jgi:hypothetical protein
MSAPFVERNVEITDHELKVGRRTHALTPETFAVGVKVPPFRGTEKFLLIYSGFGIVYGLATHEPEAVYGALLFAAIAGLMWVKGKPTYMIVMKVGSAKAKKVFSSGDQRFAERVLAAQINRIIRKHGPD